MAADVSCKLFVLEDKVALLENITTNPKLTISIQLYRGGPRKAASVAGGGGSSDSRRGVRWLLCGREGFCGVGGGAGGSASGCISGKSWDGTVSETSELLFGEGVGSHFLGFSLGLWFRRRKRRPKPRFGAPASVAFDVSTFPMMILCFWLCFMRLVDLLTNSFAFDRSDNKNTTPVGRR